MESYEWGGVGNEELTVGWEVWFGLTGHTKTTVSNMILFISPGFISSNLVYIPRYGKGKYLLNVCM